MNREHLSYVLGKLVCWMRREHSYGPKFVHTIFVDSSVKWAKKCVICGSAHETEEPKRRVERRTKD